MTRARLDVRFEKNRDTFMSITKPAEFRVQFVEDYLAENNTSGSFATLQ